MGKLTFIPLGGNGGGGERGYQGVQGAVGATGSQGIQGADGVGYQGVQGAAGLNGRDGFQGTAGLNGTDGFQGASGFQGTAGLNGINGEQGVQGATGASIQGLQGEKGSDGIQGGRGLQGEKGESIQGATGSQGTTGFQGTMGIQGPAGGGSTRYDLSTKSQAELADFYANWETVMASNDVYFGVYPVVSVNPAYTQMDIGGMTVDVMLVEYNLQLGFVDEMPNIVSGKAGAWYILPNGMGGDYTADMLFASKTYVDNGLQGKQDTLTAGEGISIQGTTISATGGGGSNQWFGTQAQFEALQSADTNTDYFISDPIDWSEITNTPTIPTMPTKVSQLANDEGFVTHHEMDNYVNATKIMHIVNSHNWYGTQAEYDTLQGLQQINPDTNYFIEGDEVSLQMTFTFTDSTQAVYDVFVRPTV